MRSRLRANCSSLTSASCVAIRYEGWPISTGTVALVPKEREKCVSPVEVRKVVWQDHKTYESSSGQQPLALSSFFFSVFLIILLTASTWLLDWGWAREAKQNLILRLEQNYLNLALSNWLLLSVTIQYFAKRNFQRELL